MKRSRVAALLLLAGLLPVLSAVSFAASSLYWVETNYGAPKLSMSDLNGTGVSSVNLTAGTLPEGLAVWADGRATWTEAAYSGARLMGAAYNLSNIIPIVTGESSLRGVAVDDVNHNVYWLSSNLITGPVIYRKTLNGPATVILTLPAGSNPRGIAVDPAYGKIFWTDAALNRVYSANLNGTGMIVLASLGPIAPWGIALHPAAQRIYCTAFGTSHVFRLNYDGSGFFAVFNTPANPTYLALDVPSLQLFWVGAAPGGQNLYRANTDGTNLMALHTPITTYGGIAIGPATTSAVSDLTPVHEFALAPAWPNPARGPVHLEVSTPTAVHLRLAVFDVQGREVAVLADGEMPAGRHDVTWDGLSKGIPTPAGIYFARMSVDGKSWTRRLVRSK